MSLFSKIKSALVEQGYKFDFYHPQFQLIPRSRDPNNADNLAMRTADALWMLGRQWQFGEFIGEDSGSPISVYCDHFKKKLECINDYNGETQGKGEVLNGVPLEVKVEGLTHHPVDLRTKVKIGQKFERIIRIHWTKSEADLIIKELRKDFGLESQDSLDKASERFLNCFREKVIDGQKILTAAENENSENGLLAGLERELQELMAWNNNLYTQPCKGFNTWQSEQLLYKFKISDGEMSDGQKSDQNNNKQDDKVVLEAPDYRSGHLDWYSFDKAKVGYSEAEIGRKTKDSHTSVNDQPKQNTAHKLQKQEMPPVNLSFRALPDKRLFAFEDNSVDLGDQNIVADDLIRMMLLDFSLHSGSDWYTVPLEMEMGELCWINQIEVKDVFGVTTCIQNSSTVGPSFADTDDDNRITSLDIWDVFKIRDQHVKEYDHTQHFLFLPPVVTKRQESKPVEEILFMRDEFSNIIWGKETMVRNKLGKAVDGDDYHLETYGPFKDANQDSSDQNVLSYKLASTVPSNWIPYLPRLNGNSVIEHYCQAQMVTNDVNQLALRPLSHLANQELKQLCEEAIPKAGLRIQITKQRVRWTDGKTYIWLGRKVKAGRGEGNSGLRFDYLR